MAEFAAATFVDTYGAFNTDDDIRQYLATEFSMDAIEAKLQDPDNTYRLAEIGDRIVGYTKLRRSQPDPSVHDNAIELERIYVDTNAKGEGIGRMLIEDALVVARAGGAGWLWLGVWERNTSAIGFYERMGFRKVGVHEFVLGNDTQIDHVMERSVESRDTV